MLASAVLFGFMLSASTAGAQDFDYSTLRNEPSPQRVGEAIDHMPRTGEGARRYLLTYCTASPGVVLPPDVRTRHPVEITIILEWQYWDLQRVDDQVRVTVSFESQPAHIVIPLNALTYFSDSTAGVAVWLRQGATSEERCSSRTIDV